MKKSFFKRFLSGLLAMLMIVLTLPMGVFAISAETQTNSQQSLWETEIYGDGVAVTKYNGTATDILVPATLTVNGVEKKVLKLGDELFADNDAINSVTLSEGILEIGEKAFYDADALVCIVTNQTLTTIGDEAFFGCDKFNSVILPDSVVSIGTDAFANCPELTVWCNEDSDAYTYATENGLACEIINPSATPDTVEQDGIVYYAQNGEAIAIDYVGDATEVTIPATKRCTRDHSARNFCGLRQACQGHASR